MSRSRHVAKLWPISTLIWLVVGVGAAERWQRLRDGNPYAPEKPVAVEVAQPPPPYEFRGVSVEKGVRYYSLLNLETKKSVWISEAGVYNGMRVQSLDASILVLAQASGKTIRLPLKELRSGAGGQQTVAAIAYIAPVRQEAVAAPALAAPEAQRLEELAEQIRQRRAERLASRG